MLNDSQRILELALESLELKKKQIEEEIAEIHRALSGKPVRKKTAPKVKKKAPSVKTSPKKSKFTEEEKLRRSQRMKKYWEGRRKKTASK